MAAMSSMRLLVVSGSAPETSLRSLTATSSAAQPPGPGLPRHAPSVNSSTWFMARLESSTHFGGGLRRADQHPLPGPPSRPHQGHGFDALARLEQVGAGRPRGPRPSIDAARKPALGGQRAEIPIDTVDIEAQQSHPITQPPFGQHALRLRRERRAPDIAGEGAPYAPAAEWIEAANHQAAFRAQHALGLAQHG